MSAVLAAGVDPRERMAAFLAEAAGLARARVGGPLTYASGAWEDVDWGLFDVVGVDSYPYARHGRPVVVTEFGCATFRGAADLGGLAWTVVDRSVSPRRLPPGTVRDEAGQAAELTGMLGAFEAAGVRGAFVYTLVAPSYPADDEDPRLDLDAASYSLVRSWPDGRTAPKASFHAVAAYYAQPPG
jgi:hypothetical protein